MLDELLTRACPCCNRNIVINQRLILVKESSLNCPHCRKKLMANSKDEWISSTLIVLIISFSGGTSADSLLGYILVGGITFGLIRSCRCLFALEKFKKKKE